MSNNKTNYQEKKYSKLVLRRNYQKNPIEFDEPNLLDFQREVYTNFLENEIDGIVKNYFPVKHIKNSKYEVTYQGCKLIKPIRTEEEARYEDKSYERPLYLNLSLVNNETGEVKTAKKSKTNLSSGVFFANIPILTEKGNFIVNGIEKIVISQIVRSPGPYILSKTQVKLNSKKKINKGFICEILPYRGTLINFLIDDKTMSVKCMMRTTSGDGAVTFPATQLLKAFGMDQDEIRRVFKDDIYILNTLYTEQYNHENILEDYEISGYRMTANDVDSGKTLSHGSPINTKLKKVTMQYEREKRT
jgi:DNA-directed RNA polymerase subunit beta